MPVKGLAIETSGRVGSVAACVDGEAVAGETFEHGLKHAAGLVPMVGRVIEQAGWTQDEVEEVYVSIGPGSFTGLRIAVTLVKGWWFAAGAVGREIRVAAVPSVRAIVENLGPEVAHAAVALDAKRGQIFTASYSRDDSLDDSRDDSRDGSGQWAERRPARLDTLAHVIETDPRPLVLTGEGLDYHTVPEPPPTPGVTLAPRELWSARAEAVGRLGHAMGRRGEWADAETLAPVYVRLPEAEEKWQAERARG